MELRFRARERMSSPSGLEFPSVPWLEWKHVKWGGMKPQLKVYLMIACTILPGVARAETQLDYYVLGREPIEGCGVEKEYRAPKENLPPRAALALFQLHHFSFESKEDLGVLNSVGPARHSNLTDKTRFYSRQFNLSSFPNDVRISLWNGTTYLIPYTIKDMLRLTHLDVKTNNPNDHTTYFRSDLSPDAVAVIDKIIQYHIAQEKEARGNSPTYDRKSTLEAMQKNIGTILKPLYDKYKVSVVEVDSGEDCD